MNTTGTGRLVEHGQDVGGRRQRHDEHAVRAMRLGKRAQVVVALLDRLDVVDDEVELAVGEDRVDAAEPLGRLRPGQERDDDADRQRPTEAQRRAAGLGVKPELGHHRQDPVPCLGR